MPPQSVECGELLDGTLEAALTVLQVDLFSM